MANKRFQPRPCLRFDQARTRLNLGVERLLCTATDFCSRSVLTVDSPLSGAGSGSFAGVNEEQIVAWA